MAPDSEAEADQRDDDNTSSTKDTGFPRKMFGTW